MTIQLIIKFHKIIDGEIYPDIDLEKRVNSVFENTNIYSYIQNVINIVFTAINGSVETINYLGVRIIAVEDPKFGFALRGNKSGNFFPSIIVGFAGDIVEFEKSIIHELLHYICWDEYVVEKKTQEIYNLTKDKW